MGKYKHPQVLSADISFRVQDQMHDIYDCNSQASKVFLTLGAYRVDL